MNKYFFFLICFIFIGLPTLGIEDEFINSSIKSDVVKPQVHTEYNYNSTKSYEIKIKPLFNIKSEKELYEGQVVEFEVINNIKYNDKNIIKNGDILTATVENIITNGMNGIPASVTFGNFKINGIEYGKISSSFDVYGRDLSLFVFPLKWALTPFPPMGSTTNFIIGGHVKIKRNKIITLYYYPEW